MTVETPQPQPGDTVLVQYRARYESGPNGDDLHRVTAGANGGLEVPGDAIIEVLERADDPSKSLRGEIREVDGVSAVCYGKNFWVRFSTTPGSVAGYGIYRDEQVVGAPVIGAVPGTPAAEAQREQQIADALPDWERELIEKESAARRSVRVPNEPHGPSAEVLQRVRDELSLGFPLVAVNVLKSATGWPLDEARIYVEGMSEYQTYLNHHGRTEIDPTEADRMRAMGFDKQPEVMVSDEDVALIESVLDERCAEYFRTEGDGYRLNTADLAGVVADIVWAAIRRDRDRAGDE